MADYYAQVFGVYPNGEAWSTGRHITSSQSQTALLTTWQNAWVTAWTTATTGFATLYPTGTVMESYQVSLLGPSMTEVSKVQSAASHAGTNVNTTLPANVSVVARWTSSAFLGRVYRGHQSLPAPAGDSVGNNNLTSTAQSHFSTSMNQVKTAIQADGSTFFLFPRFTTTTGIAAFTKHVIDTVQIRDKVGTQKQRYKKQTSIYV